MWRPGRLGRGKGADLIGDSHPLSARDSGALPGGADHAGDLGVSGAVQTAAGPFSGATGYNAGDNLCLLTKWHKKGREKWRILVENVTT